MVQGPATGAVWNCYGQEHRRKQHEMHKLEKQIKDYRESRRPSKLHISNALRVARAFARSLSLPSIVAEK